ncbi:MAG: class C sortase [Oscillospiraceae bacterium]|nr:class C sortase [Oscillospiraceae bacterium]
MSKGIKILLCVSLALLALGITLYPLVSNYFAEVNRSLIETQYTRAVEEMDDSEIIRAREDAQRYNATLLTVTDEPYTKEALRQASESYDSLLNIRGDGIMGYLSIPKLQVELPIFHGTEKETLDHGLGHLLGSSLPVGGAGTHCVITGHSGLAGQRMFSDLDKLARGDVIYVRTLDETLAYVVAEINTVLPEDTSKLKIHPQGDDLTLVTCTPYGINTHRLLVRGERISYEEAAEIEEETVTEEAAPASTWELEYRRGVMIGMVGIVVILSLIAALRIVRKPRRRKRKRRSAGRRTPVPVRRSQETRGRHETP